MVSSPIPLEYHKTDSENGFRGGAGIIAEYIGGSIFIWGGWKWSIRDSHWIHIYDVREKSWRSIRAKGDVHPGSRWASSVELNHRIYLFGGYDEDGKESNRLSSLSPRGEFRRVSSAGESPFPRWGSVGWSHKGHLYFGFGYAEGTGRRPLESYIRGGTWTTRDGEGHTNEVLKFDTKKKSFSSLATDGSTPPPRVGCRGARLTSKLYIHGGRGEGDRPLRDFFELDLKTNEWTELKECGLTSAKKLPSLTAIGPKQIMLVGGADNWGGENPSNLVLIYDTATSSWREDQRLPAEVCGEGGGLSEHNAVAVREGNRIAKIVCVGGYTNFNVFSRQLFEFDVAAASQ